MLCKGTVNNKHPFTYSHLNKVKFNLFICLLVKKIKTLPPLYLFTSFLKRRNKKKQNQL